MSRWKNRRQAMAQSLLAVLTVACLTLAKVPTSAGMTHPNIVFVLTDDLAWNLVQFMPNVLQMQANGATFSLYFVTDSLCCPSRSSIFTGRYPHHTGVWTNHGWDGGWKAFVRNGNDQSTFATMLSSAGYLTGMYGKYLNGYKPTDPADPGWSSWGVVGWGYPEFGYRMRQDSAIVHYGSQPKDYLTDVLDGLATTFIREAGDRPYLLEVATFAPHHPFVPAPRDANAFPGLEYPRTPAFDAAPTNPPNWLKRIAKPLTAHRIAKINKIFRRRAESVLAVDKMIGDLQAAINQAGQQDRTYLVFSSDNGYHEGELRMRPGKRTPYDTDINVPLIVTGPGVAGGSVINEIVENVDLAPTFLELAGVSPLANTDGISFTPLLQGNNPSVRRTAVLIEHHKSDYDPTDPDVAPPSTGDPPDYEGMRTLTELYVEYATAEGEYHNLQSDPYELANTFSALSAAQVLALHNAMKQLE